MVTEQIVNVVYHTYNHKLFKKVCSYHVMNLGEVVDILLSQREEISEKFQRERIIEREYDREKIKRFLKYPNIVAILGVRRCGKSIFSQQIMENAGYVNFDDERFIYLDAKDLNKVLQAIYEIYGKVDSLILDEPQNIRSWELFANRLRRTKKVIVTGSNSRLLSGELATALTGRHIDVELYPFSFREFLRYENLNFEEKYYSTARVAEIKRALEKYMEWGGLPERYLFGREILVRIYGDILEKDIVRRLGVRKTVALREFVKSLFSNISREFTYRKVANIVNVRDVHTLKNWLMGIQEAYLGFTLNRFSYKLKDQLIAPRKFYSIDTGLAQTVAFRISQDRGRVMENIVAIELLRRKSYWHPEWEIYYWKDHQQREVDFVLKEGERIKELIQVTYASGRDEIGEREIKSLLKAGKELGCEKKTVITWDYEDEGEIKFIPLWKWLLKTE